MLVNIFKNIIGIVFILKNVKRILQGEKWKIWKAGGFK